MISSPFGQGYHEGLAPQGSRDGGRLIIKIGQLNFALSIAQHFMVVQRPKQLNNHVCCELLSVRRLALYKILDLRMNGVVSSERPTSMAKLHSKAHEEILNVIDQLRSEGISRHVDLPQLIVCGECKID